MLTPYQTQRRRCGRTVVNIAVGLFSTACSILTSPVVAGLIAGGVSSSYVESRTSMALRVLFHKSALCTVSTESGLIFGLLWRWIAHGTVLTAADVCRWCLVRHGICG
jgi:hypothetical protein